MPTYQYACTACDERLEAVQSFTDAPLTGCPACGGALRKVFSAVGVVFKGSGFYKTDSRGAAAGKGEGKTDGKGDGKGAGTGDGKGDGKGASAPAAKGDGKAAGAAASPASSATPAAASSGAGKSG